MKNKIIIVLSFLGMAGFSITSAQNLIYDTARVYDIVTEDDTSWYLFPSYKPCFTPRRYDWAPVTLVQEYEATDTVTVYGVAITYNYDNCPIYDDNPYITALLMKKNGVSSTGISWTSYSMNLIDTVTLNRSHPRFCWFRYEDDCNPKNVAEVPCYELYFDTPQQIDRMTGIFYVGRQKNILEMEDVPSLPREYGGEYDASISSTLYQSWGITGNALEQFALCQGYQDRKWGVFFPIIGLRCGPIKEYWLDAYTGDSAVVRWRSVEQGTLFNVRLVGEDGSDTTIVTSDTTVTFARLSDTVRYNVMLRKQCHYCTSNYNDTVYGRWLSTLSFGDTQQPDTSSGGNDTIDTTGGGGVEGVTMVLGEDFSLNPNPARGSVQVLLPVAALGGRLTLCDLSGRELMVHTVAGTTMDLDVSALPSGSYLVKLTTPASTTVKKLLLR